MNVTETDLRQWADRIEARSLAPVLVRRLIRVTTPTLKDMRFPGNDAVALQGTDGETNAEAGTPWVPAGRAVWEIGCNQDPSSKASDDYDKRVKDTPAEVRASTTFVFVTPRRWQQKDAWVKKRRGRGDWRDVRVFDAVDLETWLDEAPVTERWIGERLGRAHLGLLTPEEWYRGWASVSVPNIPMELVANRRGNAQADLLDKLRGGDRTVPVVADSRQEAVAYVIAALTQAGADDLLDRVLVVTSKDVIPSAQSGREPKPILILDLPDEDVPALADRDRFQIVRPMAKGRVNEREVLELPHVGAEAFREALEAAGFPRERAQKQAYDVGHSVTVLRRYLADDPEVRRPRWARDRTSARQVMPHAIAGGWIEGERHDDPSMLALLGDASEADILAGRAELTGQDDAPLARIGNATVTVSQIDALFAIGPFLEIADIDRFCACATEALGERDPILDRPQDEWWWSNRDDEVRSCSETMLSGLGDALGILAVHGDAICGQRLGFDVPARIARVVRALLSDMTEDRWLSLRRHLRPLADAAPDAFLACLEADLDQPEPPVAAIMGCAGEGITRECLRPDLLWALEALAWSPRHFARVAELVFRLRALEPDENWGNTPSGTAKALFRDWLPATTLGGEDRMAVLRRLAKRHRGPVIEVCASLIDTGPRGASRTAMPRWRSVEGDYDAVTTHDLWAARRAASALLLDLAPLDDAEIRSVVEVHEGLQPDDLQRLHDEVARWAGTADDAAVADLAKYVRAKRGRADFMQRRKGTDDDIETTIQSLDAMAEHLRPTDLRHRHRWLFEQDYISWPALDLAELEEDLDFRHRDELVHERRKAALVEIEEVLGRTAVYDFALEFGQPRIVARTLAGSEAPHAEVLHWAERALRDDRAGSEDFLAAVLFTTDEAALTRVVGDLEQLSCLKDPATRGRLGRCLPGVAAGWSLAERMGGDVEGAYWSTVNINIFRDTSDSDAEFVARHLLDAGRPQSAYAAVCYEPGKLTSKTWLDILHGVVTGGTADGPMPDRHHLIRILDLLEAAPDITDEQIAVVEWSFAKLLRTYSRREEGRVWAIHRLMIRNPEEFVSLLRCVYKRRDHAPEPDKEVLNAEQRRLRATLSYDVLDEWTAVPGMGEEGVVDAAAFATWHEDVFRIAEEHDRLSVALVHVGACLARLAASRGFEDWLPGLALDLLDRRDMAELRRHFEIGVRNARGVTTRGPYDGGTQERDLARTYRGLARRHGNSHPRVASMLEEIASDYDREGRDQDEQAQLGERWHP